MIANDIFFRQVQEINLDFATIGREAITYQDSLFLEGIASTTFPSRVYAQGVLAMLYGRSFAPVEYIFGEEEYRQKTDSHDSKLLLIPNPTSGFTTLEFDSKHSYSTTLDLYDLTGKILISNIVNIVKGKNEIGIDTQKLQSGVYIIQFNGLDKLYSVKLVKN